MDIVNLKIFNYSDDITCHWKLFCDNIGGGRGWEGKVGGKAAPAGVATGIILVYKEGGGGSSLWWYLFGIIWDGYCFIFENFIMDNMEEKKVMEEYHILLNQYQQVENKKKYFLVVVYWYVMGLW